MPMLLNRYVHPNDWRGSSNQLNTSVTEKRAQLLSKLGISKPGFKEEMGFVYNVILKAV